jgi:hypothetical protein
MKSSRPCLISCVHVRDLRRMLETIVARTYTFNSICVYASMCWLVLLRERKLLACMYADVFACIMDGLYACKFPPDILCVYLYECLHVNVVHMHETVVHMSAFNDCSYECIQRLFV